MTGTHVCIVKVTEIRKGVFTTPDQVVLDVRRVSDSGSEFLWAGMVLLMPYFMALTGRVPVVGDVFKIVTTGGKWPT